MTESRCNFENSLTGRKPEMIPNHQEIPREPSIRRSELPDMKPVVSSNIYAIGYDPVNKEMFVLFAKDAPYVYRYPQIDAERFNFIRKAESIGKAFASNITRTVCLDPTLAHEKLRLLGDGVAVVEGSP